MTLTQIRLVGCDDYTEIELDLTPDEIRTVEKISAASVAASTYGCEPRLILDGDDL
jgi:hypothetical protein